MRAGRIEEASACARRVGKAIEKKTKKHLLGIDSNTGPKELWESVRAIQGKRKEDRNSENLTAEDFNAHYAAMSTDPAYTAPLMKMTLASQKRNQATNEPEVSHLLDHLHHAAEGNDELPAWLLRLVAPVYTEAIALLFNRSIAASHVPKQWNTAIIRPVAKTKNPDNIVDYRPISITPVLSRMVEKIVVCRYIYPAFNLPVKQQLYDQFAFRPSGSTPAALIAIIHQITTLLETNESVTLISLDFSKAFDTVRHAILATKLATLDIPNEIYNWMMNFMKDRGHVTKYGGRISGILYINTSVFQGSGFGPTALTVNASDLKPLYSHNYCQNKQMARTLLLDLVDVLIFLLNWTIFLNGQQVIICD